MDLARQADLALALVSTLAGPLRAAVAGAAIQVMAEPADQPNHDVRVKLAKRALRDPAGITDTFAWAVSTNTTLVERWATGDQQGIWADVPFVVSTVWDALSQSWAELL